MISSRSGSHWLSYGGADPVAYIEKYASQLDVVHLKDYLCGELPTKPVWQLLTEGLRKPQKRSEVGFRYVPVGSGVENWAAILAAIRNSSASYVVVEQDDSKDCDPLEAAKISRDFLQSTFGI